MQRHLQSSLCNCLIGFRSWDQGATNKSDIRGPEVPSYRDTVKEESYKSVKCQEDASAVPSVQPLGKNHHTSDGGVSQTPGSSGLFLHELVFRAASMEFDQRLLIRRSFSVV